ncbi:MAG TPA: NAD(P)H-hydrate dehydratase [Acidimicrobiia bacterium]|nr:NAD(P)H-hydrate dehydratase [Acidimicrobiia bacterium]
MLPVITPAEARRLDDSSSVGVDVLMERAGSAVAAAAAGMGMAYGKRAVVLAGPGNNGGDGYVAARILKARGVGVTVRALAAPRTAEAQLARQRAMAAGVDVDDLGDPEPFDLVIDGLFGGSFRPDPAVTGWIQSEQRVLSVDVPSGLDPLTGGAAGAAFRAERTVTFGAYKVGHLLSDGPDLSGEVEVVDIGLPSPEPTMYLVEEVDASLPRRSRRAHKWSAGSVLVVGGAVGMTGAAVMAGRAALHFGAGAVGLAVPESAASVAAANAPDLLQHRLEDLPDRYRVLVIGPGLGHEHDDLAAKLIATWNGPVVVDADALSLVTEPDPKLVLTPHAGEFERLGGGEPTPENAVALARKLKATVLLKGNPTVIAGDDVPWIVNSGGPELATIGTGDVLSGMIGALLAQGLEPAAAARAAAFWHGRAGAQLAARTTVTAPSLIEEIGHIR